MRGEDGERAIVVGAIRRKLGVACIKAQCHSLLGRLDSLGPGSAAAASRRRQAAELDKHWRQEQAAYCLSVSQGWSIHRAGFAKLD